MDAIQMLSGLGVLQTMQQDTVNTAFDQGTGRRLVSQTVLLRIKAEDIKNAFEASAAANLNDQGLLDGFISAVANNSPNIDDLKAEAAKRGINLPSVTDVIQAIDDIVNGKPVDQVIADSLERITGGGSNRNTNNTNTGGGNAGGVFDWKMIAIPVGAIALVMLLTRK